MGDNNLFSGAYTDVPAVERKPSTLRLDLQYGCPSAGCSFCKFYRDHKFSNRPLEEVLPTLSISEEMYKHTPLGGPREDQTLYAIIDHLFLGGADTLRYPSEDFLKIVKESKARFGGRIHRVAFYATTNSILEAPDNFFSRLKEEVDLAVIYWGIETGCTELLEYVHKKGSKREILAAGERLNQQGIGISANVMIGLGEKKFSLAHVQDTAEVIASINPRWLNIFPRDYSGTAYERTVLSDQENSFLNETECVTQLADFLSHLARTTRPEKCIETIAAYSPFGMNMTDMAKNRLFLRGDHCTEEVLLNLEQKIRPRINQPDNHNMLFGSPDLTAIEEMLREMTQRLENQIKDIQKENERQERLDETYVRWRNRTLVAILSLGAIGGGWLYLSGLTNKF